MTPYMPELNELAEKALAKIMPERATGAIVTRGLLIMEVLQTDSEHRGVFTLQLGRQGVLMPWEMIGLMSVPAQRARSVIDEWLWTGDDNGGTQ